MEETKQIKTDFLVNETVIVKFLPRKVTKEIQDPKHIAYGGKLEGCFDYIAPPRLRKDKLQNILTKEEKEGLEYLMSGVNLSIYSDFWKGYTKDSLFPIALSKEDMYLNLSVPEDYIKYKVLINNRMVATNREQLKLRGTYKYIIEKEEDSLKRDNDDLNTTEKAFELFGKIKKSKPAMRYILSKFDKYTHQTQKSDFLIAEIGKELKKNASKFVSIADDEYLATKVLLNEAFQLGVIERIDGQYFTHEREPISEKGVEPNEYNASKYLSSPVGQELRLSIQARVKNAREQ